MGSESIMSITSSTEVVLRNRTGSGEDLEAVFNPGKGMNLLSFKRGSIQIIDQSSRSLFEESSNGLGAIIGPHFGSRKLDIIPPVSQTQESLFTHITRLKEIGISDPFAYGIGRYAPWQFQSTSTKIQGTLSGKDIWNGVPLSALEGQGFKMWFSAELTASALEIEMSVVSDSDSLVGIQYHYRLPNGKGKIVSSVQKEGIFFEGRREIFKEYNLDSQQRLTQVLGDEVEKLDCVFLPFPDHRRGDILLETEEYHLLTSYSCVCQENSWKLSYPNNASYVCIQPVSSQDPYHPNLTVSSIKIRLEIGISNATVPLI